MFSYPEFSGTKGEDIFSFLEQMEVACISNHIVEPAQVLRLMQICIKGDARTWLKDFEARQQATQPPQVVTVEGLKEALKQEFQKT